MSTVRGAADCLEREGHRPGGHARRLKGKVPHLGRSARVFQVSEIAVKEERRVLEYASDGLNGKVGCLGNPRGLERFDTGAGGSILDRQAQVLELVADGVGQTPVLGGAGLGAGLENLGSGLVHVVARVGDQAGGNA